MSKLRKLLLSLLRISIAVLVAFILAYFGALLYFRQPSWRKPAYICSHRSDPKALENIVKTLSEQSPPRCADKESGLKNASDYIASKVREFSSSVEIQAYNDRDKKFENVISHFGEGRGNKVIIGAHYDVCDLKPGADDNASGVAGLTELARLMSLEPPPIAVDLVAYSTEEPPYFGSQLMGSYVHSNSLKKGKETIDSVVVLEMIGYFSGSQERPHPTYKLLYPGKADFILVAGRQKDRNLISNVKAAIKGAGGIKVYSFASPIEAGIDDSDNRNYWMNGFTAVMITDTAYHRNPNYHSMKDTYDTLDYNKMARIVDGVFLYIMMKK
jgi:Zn-dependent M28 family amino/carboxypeptidase